MQEVYTPTPAQGRADLVRPIRIFVVVVGGEDVDTTGEQRLQGVGREDRGRTHWPGHRLRPSAQQHSTADWGGR